MSNRLLGPLLRPGRRQVAGAGVALAAAGVTAWVLQHRLVVRSAAEAAGAGDAFTMPAGLVHHRVDLDDGGVAHAVEIGTGPPVVLVHGVTLAVEVWCQQLAELSVNHRVIAVDVRGHGQSVVGADGFSGGMGRLAADLRQVFDALDVHEAVLVGHSMGGMVALQLVTQEPTAWVGRRVRALALVDTSAGPLAGLGTLRRAHGPMSAAVSKAMLVTEGLGVGVARSADVQWWTARFAFGPDPAPSQVAFAQSLGSATSVTTLAGLLPVLAGFDVADRLPGIELPVLVVVGTHDHLTPPSHSRRMVDALPRAELVELARAGHMAMLERPHELARLIDELAGKVQAGA